MSDKKVAIVTGSNKGIGFGIVKALCQTFDGVVYLTSRDVNRGKEAIGELEKLGLQPKYHQLDINDEESVKNLHDFIKSKHGGFDVLVNNAAIAYKIDARESFGEQAENTIKVNYFGLLRVCNGLFDLLRPYARVVNISSSCGHLFKIPDETLRQKLSDPNLTVEKLSELMNQFVDSAKNNLHVQEGWGTSAYNVSKVGVSSLTIIQQRAFDKDSSRPGIVVNSVHPGYVDTDMTSHKGVRTIEQGADAPTYLALLPKDTDIKGKYLWYDRQIVDWYGPETPTKW